MKTIGVSGYGATGSSAIYDFISEFDNIRTLPSGKECEFTLPYDVDGLLDLRHALVECPVKHLAGDSAIANFIKLTNMLSRSLMRETNGKFNELTKRFLDSIIVVKYSGVRRSNFVNNRFSCFLYKLGRVVELYIEKYYRSGLRILPRANRYISVMPSDYDEKAKHYICEILKSAGINNEDTVLLDQPYSPNCPERSFVFFDNPMAVIVNRDPRDIYIYAREVRAASVVEFIPHNTVEDFVAYFKAVSQYDQNENKNCVLRIFFEDLIYETERTKSLLVDFLGLGQHKFIRKYFQPEMSIRNTQIYKAYPEYKNDIAYIEKELKEYLYPFEKYERIVDKKAIISNDKFKK